jgi:hypothetical protein
MSLTENNIYELLPAYYRIKDIEQGSPLQALINIIAQKATDLENNIGQLYDNWFIETCEEWVVPYIADLLGVQNLTAITGSSAISQRAYVANTLAYRRRKGIAPVLEQLSNDIAGWPAHVVEFFQLLSTTQYMNHIRLDHPVTPDLRLMNQLDLLNSPFDSIAHSVDVRHISNGRGKYNIGNIGLFIWRIQSYKVVLGDAAKMPCLSSPLSSDAYFTFSPIGYDLQLFNNPKTETEITHISGEINLPVALRRRALFDELEARRQNLVDGTPVTYTYFDDTPEVAGDLTTRRHPVFEVFPNDNKTPVPPEEIFICDLEQCCRPPKGLYYRQSQNNNSISVADLLTSPPASPPSSVYMPITVAADPVTGRFIFADPSVTKARVSYSYGFSGDIGSGTYNRQETIPGVFLSTNSASNNNQNSIWQVGVSKTIQSVDNELIFTNITDALNAWKQVDESIGIISIMDNESYYEDLNFQIDEKQQLLIIAAGWPEITPDKSLPDEKVRINGIISASGLRPLIDGAITIGSSIKSPPDFDTRTEGQVTLNGLLIRGKLSISEGNLAVLSIDNCTLVPESGGIEIGADTSNVASNQWLQVSVKKSICGSIDLHDTEIESLILEDSIVDNQNDWAILSSGSPLQASRTTVLGKIFSKTLTAENCIFNELVTTERRQTGCVRFSYVPPQSETPRHFHCQPDLEISIQTNQVTANQVTEWLVPSFTSSKYGHYGYAQLSINSPTQISAGADDSAEMGAFNLLKQPQRKANLLIALDEYLRLGLEAGLFYVT